MHNLLNQFRSLFDNLTCLHDHWTSTFQHGCNAGCEAVSGRNHQKAAPKICDSHASNLIVVSMQS
jgi:hypothetical protein